MAIFSFDCLFCTNFTIILCNSFNKILFLSIQQQLSDSTHNTSKSGQLTTNDNDTQHFLSNKFLVDCIINHRKLLQLSIIFFKPFAHSDAFSLSHSTSDKVISRKFLHLDSSIKICGFSLLPEYKKHNKL